MSKTVWYIQPFPGHTSEVLGREVSPEDLCYEVWCADGKKRNLYRCEWQFLHTALKSMENQKLRFTVWRQQGARPPVRFDPVKVFRGRRSPEVLAMCEALVRVKANKAAQK